MIKMIETIKKYWRSRTVKAAVATMLLGVVEYQTKVFVTSLGGENVGLIVTALGGAFLVLRAITTEAISDK
ncbi:hypothetical protein [Limnobacter sp.]|uniref:hypothetical protein n=1 Tax=Limnobacter sp. TaxID=2003368 RepID=UPI0035136F08